MYKRVLKYIKPYWKHLVGSILATMLFAILSGALVWLVGPLMGTLFSLEGYSQVSITQSLDSSKSVGKQLAPTFTTLKENLKNSANRLIIGKTKYDTLKKLCIIIILVVFFKVISDYIHSYLMAFVQQSVTRDLRAELYSHYQKLSLDYFQRTRTGQLMSRITNDVLVLNDAIDITFARLIRDPLLVIIFLGFILIINWKLTLLAMIVLPLSLFAITRIGRYLKKYSTRTQERMADINSILEETVSGMRIVKGFAKSKFEISKFKKALQRHFSAILKMTRVRLLSNPINEFLATVVGVIILWYGGRQVLIGEFLKPDDFILYIFAMFSLIQPVKSLSQVYGKIQEGMAATQRIFEVLDTKPKVISSPQGVKKIDFKDSLVFEHVHFEYNPGDVVLKDIDLLIKAGEIVAFVGPSGAGKSTLLDLVPRFYDPTSGQIKLDGIDIKDIDVEYLRGLLGIVTQETILFYDTVFNNIAYGMENVLENKVISAAKIANAHDFITNLPEGYQTYIGTRGFRLSGGERQRLAIARAVLRDPKILVFDEATSSLDTESEILVQEAIDRLMQDRTTLVIAHRLSTVQHADKIVVLDKGEIVQQDRHSELVEQEGLYRKLYNLQFNYDDYNQKS
ncbi:MAG: ABC transporter ATP-binding protein/permease [candidate division Zixibacteria bacterium]|nr:ABC transporter ATP-binding protein/permease [candidate division Zixibacteria bacterium]